MYISVNINELHIHEQPPRTSCRPVLTFQKSAGISSQLPPSLPRSKHYHGFGDNHSLPFLYNFTTANGFIFPVFLFGFFCSTSCLCNSSGLFHVVVDLSFSLYNVPFCECIIHVYTSWHIWFFYL